MKDSKAKKADELDEIISGQLDILTGAKVTADDVMVANAVATQIGKSLKLAGLRLAYKEHRDKGGEIIETLEARKAKK